MEKGRKPKEIAQNQFENLVSIGMSQNMIGEFFGVTPSTLRSWIRKTYGEEPSKVVAQFRAAGNMRILAYGEGLARKSAAVWIFQAKNRLGWSDNPAPQDTGERSQVLANAINAAVKKLDDATIEAQFEAMTEQTQDDDDMGQANEP
jgi:uncharacterized protein YjcR